jgi:hypothetical protein
MAEVRQTNRTMTALANHRHDVDGNTVFLGAGTTVDQLLNCESILRAGGYTLDDLTPRLP